MRASVAFVVLAGCATAGTPSQQQGTPDASGSNSHMPDAAPMCVQGGCDDQNMCTIDMCVPATGCMHMTNTCDDSNACTVDSCDMVMGCKHDLPHGTMTFNATGAMQTFSVPTCVTSLHIVASGAQGGNAEGGAGGLGATATGDFTVTPGQAVSILVGGRGVDYNANPPTSIYAQRGGTGGGGTFVVAGTTILEIAGGGGGASGRSGVGVGNGGPGQTTTAGQTPPGTAGAGGANGGGGGTISNANGFHVGTGGGGYSGNGIGASDGSVSSYGTANEPGTAFVNGGAGGVGGSVGRSGGFGGGGAAGATGGGGGG
ncbi:MAG: hypothetical protein JO257_36490, partial [Deltaproteobacteria bacterium]|nr:hypothetical protein [Deltaproteobacteria bacterium]